jgi:hypothetical protein
MGPACLTLPLLALAMFLLVIYGILLLALYGVVPAPGPQDLPFKSAHGSGSMGMLVRGPSQVHAPELPLIPGLLGILVGLAWQWVRFPRRRRIGAAAWLLAGAGVVALTVRAPSPERPEIPLTVEVNCRDFPREDDAALAADFTKAGMEKALGLEVLRLLGCPGGLPIREERFCVVRPAEPGQEGWARSSFACRFDPSIPRSLLSPLEDAIADLAWNRVDSNLKRRGIVGASVVCIDLDRKHPAYEAWVCRVTTLRESWSSTAGLSAEAPDPSLAPK